MSKLGTLSELGKNRKLLSEVGTKLAGVKRKLAEVKMELDLLKKGAVYFAKESQ